MGNFSEALKISKSTTVKVADYISRKSKPEDIDFIREFESNETNFGMSEWSEYENDFRKLLYEKEKFPKMGLTKEQLDYIFECFRKGLSVSMGVNNFKDESIIPRNKNSKRPARSDRERSPYDKR